MSAEKIVGNLRRFKARTTRIRGRKTQLSWGSDLEADFDLEADPLWTLPHFQHFQKCSCKVNSDMPVSMALEFFQSELEKEAIHPFEILGKVYFSCFWLITFEAGTLRNQNYPLLYISTSCTYPKNLITIRGH